MSEDTTEHKNTTFLDSSTHDLESNNHSSNRRMGFMQERIAASVVESVFERTKIRAQKYTKIDIFRQYFDVNPHIILQRIINSFSLKHRADDLLVNPDYYGPLMLCLTFVAILHYYMKQSSTFVLEGTLLGTSFATCLGFWISSTLIYACGGYLFECSLGLIEFGSLTGYQLSGYVVSIASACISSSLFIVVAIVAGVLCSGRLGLVLYFRCKTTNNGTLLGGFAFIFHFFFLFYLKASYPAIIKSVS